MTDDARQDKPKGGTDLARFLQDWTTLWREELQAQANDPEVAKPGMFAGMAKGGMTPDIAAATALWHSAMLAWADVLGAKAPGAEALGAKAPGAEALRAEALGPGTVGGSAAEAGISGTGASRVPPSPMVPSRDRAATPRAKTAAAAPDARDAEIERLTRRVDELAGRLAKLETPRRRRS